MFVMASMHNPLLQDFVFPPYDVIEAKHICPAIQSLIRKLECDLTELENTVEPTWPKLVVPLEKIVDRLSVVWGMVNHLNSVKDSSELRAAIEQIQPEKVEFQLKLRQSKPIYCAFKAVKDSADWENLNDARKRVVEMKLKEAVLNGVSLEDTKRVRFNEIEQELEKLAQKFEENILDATKRFEKLVSDKKEIEGLPLTTLSMAAETAILKGYEKATADNGPWILTLDGPIYRSVLQHGRNRSLREEVYRAYVTRASDGSVNNTPLIERILELRQEKAKLLGYSNYAEVSMETKMATIATAKDLIEKLHSASWNPAIQDMEDLRDFAIGQEEAKDMNRWDINFWSERLRESKYDINEVEAVFHEFGHALQHMLTKQDEGLVSGSQGIEWDAVEIASQFMENWCYQRDTMMSIARHYETGESLPEDTCLRILSSRTFRAGSQLLRQLRYAGVDLELHSNYVPGVGTETIYDIDQRIGKRTHVLPLLPEDRFLCSFSHIFADKYAAGYYSYQWAEVLSADAFSAFEEAGLENDQVFLEFRGREPLPNAFLRYNGLLLASSQA